MEEARHDPALRMLEMPRLVAPPSVLPDISPAWGEITRVDRGDWLISPLAGEMSGRTEGGAVERRHFRPETPGAAT
jgi:hypothetical protein